VIDIAHHQREADQEHAVEERPAEDEIEDHRAQAFVVAHDAQAVAQLVPQAREPLAFGGGRDLRGGDAQPCGQDGGKREHARLQAEQRHGADGGGAGGDERAAELAREGRAGCECRGAGEAQRVRGDVRQKRIARGHDERGEDAEREHAHGGGEEAQEIERQHQREHDRQHRRAQLQARDIAAQVAPVGVHAANEDEQHHGQGRDRLRDADARVAFVQLMRDQPREDDAHHAARCKVGRKGQHVRRQGGALARRHAAAPVSCFSAVMLQSFVVVSR